MNSKPIPIDFYELKSGIIGNINIIETNSTNLSQLRWKEINH